MPGESENQNRARLLAAALLTLTVGAYGVVVVAVDPPVAVAAPRAAAAKVTELPDAVSAALAARNQRARVEITGARTASTTTWANPDGTFTTDSASGPVRVRRGDDWVPVDTTLADTGAAVTPAAATAQVEFSDGGSEPFARVGHGSRSFGLSWSGSLPAPALHGDTATYADVVAGGDLQVRALPDGFSERVVLRERPSGPVTIRLPFGLTGMSLRQLANGHLVLSDASGRQVAQAAAPHMWDSSVDPASGLPGRDAKVAATIENTTSGPVLVLKPDSSFFAGNVTYPVTIDPTTTLAVTTDTWVEDPNYADSQLGSDELRTGTYDGGTHRARAYMKFDVSKYVGKHITDTNLRLYSYYSSTCSTGGSGMRARRVTTSWDSSTIAFDNLPEVTGTGEVINTGAWGYNSTCPANYSNWDIDAIVQAWAAGQVVTPADEDRTQAAVSLSAAAPTGKTGVTYRYHAGTDTAAAWTAVPVGDVALPGTTTTLSGWPQTRTDTSANFGALVWNAARTLGADGALQVKACFTAGTTAEECSARSAPRSARPTPPRTSGRVRSRCSPVTSRSTPRAAWC